MMEEENGITGNGKLPREKGPIPRPGRRSRTIAPMAVPSQRRLGLCNIVVRRRRRSWRVFWRFYVIGSVTFGGDESAPRCCVELNVDMYDEVVYMIWIFHFHF
jgi:hypothetical protein